MKRSATSALALALALTLLSAGAGRRVLAGPLDDISIPEMKEKMIHAIEGSDKKAPARKAPEGREDYKRRIERRLDWLDGRIHQLKLDATNKGVVSRDRLNRELPDLTKQRESAQRKLDELGARSGEAWDDLKAGLDTALHKLEHTLDRIGSEI